MPPCLVLALLVDESDDRGETGRVVGNTSSDRSIGPSVDWMGSSLTLGGRGSTNSLGLRPVNAS